MMKWLLLAVVVVAVLWWLGRGRRSGRGADPGAAATRSNRNAAGGAHPQGPSDSPEPMVACAHCGVWLPKADAVGESGSVSPEGRLYCSEAHRRAGPARE